jgi:hypothetical protein
MKKIPSSKIQRILRTIFPIMIAASNSYQIESIDVDVIITPTQAQIHWHYESTKKHVGGRRGHH